MAERDGHHAVSLHYVDPLQAVKHLLRDKKFSGALYTWYELKTNSNGKRVIGPLNTRRLIEMFCQQLAEEGNSDCAQAMFIFAGDDTIGGKSQVTGMLYVSLTLFPDWMRQHEWAWAVVGCLPVPGKVSKRVCPKYGPYSQMVLHIELCQMSWKLILSTIIECERNKTVKVWEVGGRLMKLRLAFGYLIGDLMQHWKFLGEMLGTCPLCRVRKSMMAEALPAPIKTAEGQARRMMEAIMGRWAGYTKWGKRRAGAPPRPAVRLLQRGPNGERVPTAQCTDAGYE